MSAASAIAEILLVAAGALIGAGATVLALAVYFYVKTKENE